MITRVHWSITKDLIKQAIGTQEKVHPFFHYMTWNAVFFYVLMKHRFHSIYPQSWNVAAPWSEFDFIEAKFLMFSLYLSLCLPHFCLIEERRLLEKRNVDSIFFYLLHPQITDQNNDFQTFFFYWTKLENRQGHYSAPISLDFNLRHGRDFFEDTLPSCRQNLFLWLCYLSFI